jgi:hypothetical protein
MWALVAFKPIELAEKIVDFFATASEEFVLRVLGQLERLVKWMERTSDAKKDNVMVKLIEQTDELFEFVNKYFERTKLDSSPVIMQLKDLSVCSRRMSNMYLAFLVPSTFEESERE